MATRTRDTGPPGKANKPTSSKLSTIGSGSKPRRKSDINSSTSTAASSTKRAPNDVRSTMSSVHDNPKQQGKKPISGGDIENKPVRRRSFDKPPTPSNTQNMHGSLSPRMRSSSFSGVSTLSPTSGPPSSSQRSTLSPTSGQSPSSRRSALSPTTGQSPSSQRSTLSPTVGQSPLSRKSTFTPTPGSSSSTRRSMTPVVQKEASDRSLKAPKEVGKQHLSQSKPVNSTKKSTGSVKKKEVRRGPSTLKEQPECLPQEKVDDPNSDDTSEIEIKSQDQELESNSTIDDKEIVDDINTNDSLKAEIESRDEESSIDETEQPSVKIGKSNEERHNYASMLEDQEDANDEETKETTTDNNEGQIVTIESSTMDADESNIASKPKDIDEFNTASKLKDADDLNTLSEPKDINEFNTTTELKDIDESSMVLQAQNVAESNTVSKPKDAELVPPKSSTISQTGTDEISTSLGPDFMPSAKTEEPKDNINPNQNTRRNAINETNMKEKEEETIATGSETKDQEVDEEKKDTEKPVPRSHAQAAKQTDNAVSNDAIEETAAKLREQRKNRVRALAGAFESVISLQDSKS